MKKVLVIDDTLEVRTIIGETLNCFGFSAVLAEDGFLGIELAKTHLPDLIICDVNMPLLDGYETLTALRENESTSTIPFIFLSGAAEKPNIRRGMELGADDYLSKPFRPSELLAAVNARLEKQAEIRRQSEKQLNELRGNITLALPHELRTPLNGILGLSAILMEDYATLPPREVLESARYIHTSALRLHRLIENFLIYSQIELIEREAKSLVAPDNCTSTVEMAVPEIASQVSAKAGRERDLQLSLEPAGLRVTPENLKKIVEEILDNAFKFSHPQTPVILNGWLEAGSYHMSIIGSGRGMTADQIAKIGPHVQFDREIYEQQGAGLGLFIAMRLTQLHGGEFKIESVPNQRTKVIFTLPLMQSPAAFPALLK